MEVNVYIYIAAPVGKLSPCKIGFSGSPERRIETLNCGRESKMELRHVRGCSLQDPNWRSSSPYREINSTARQIERQIHDELKLFRTRDRGEWFDIEDFAAAFVVDKTVKKICGVLA